MTEKKIYSIEYLVFDSELIDIAKVGDYHRLELFIQQSPQHEQVIRDALLLLQSLKIEEEMIPEGQIDDDYRRLMDHVSHKKSFHLVKWLSIAAACLLFTFGFLFLHRSNRDGEYRDRAFSLLDSIQINKDSIILTNGASRIMVNEDQTLSQTSEGGVVTAQDELINADQIHAEFLQLVVPRGKRTSLVFNDGTRVWVNSGSKIIYPKIFEPNKREIFLDGEIYIEVAKDRSRPFFVNSKGIRVQVLGTKFNMSVYSEDREKSVILSEGSVNVLSQQSNHTALLKPNQGFFVVDGEASIRNIDAGLFVCWKDNLMKLEAEPLMDIFKRLSRHYAVEFHTNKNLVAEKYTGTLTLSGSLDEVLKTLSFGTPFTYSKTGDTYYLKF